jgi:hypothetical protein
MTDSTALFETHRETVLGVCDRLSVAGFAGESDDLFRDLRSATTLADLLSVLDDAERLEAACL